MFGNRPADCSKLPTVWWGRQSRFGNPAEFSPPGPVAAKPLRKDLRWEEIKIQFLNNEEVVISFRDQQIPKSYKDMGMKRKNSEKWTEQWQLLINVADNHGVVPLKNISKNRGVDTATQKQKQLLSKKLRKFFGLGS